jgi:prepilin-type N-terminal cleavage/methylation domain-containing protein/prepilin-type processing-associated H-X9-DG protein
MSRSHSENRPAFTLVELLVVITIIGILVAMLLPAVQGARESARRTRCVNNLKQLGLAVHNFHDVHKFLPVSNRPLGLTTAPRIGWAVNALPYLEQQALFQQYDQSQTWSSTTPGSGQSASNQKLCGTVLPVFYCSSAPPAETRLDSEPQNAPTWLGFAATTDYSPTISVDQRLVTLGLVDNYPAPGVGSTWFGAPGLLAQNSVARLDDATDGLTTTIMLAESAGRPELYRLGKKVGNVPQHIVNGGGWMRPASDFSIDGSSYDGTTLPGPCPMNCTNGDDEGGPAKEPYPYYVTQGTGEAYSFHPGGANFVFGDGAVHFLSENISIRDFGRLVTRDQQEVVQAP